MKNLIVAEAVLALILVIIGDGVAAALAARLCWRIRKRAKLALPFAIVLMALAIEDMNSIVNHAVNLQGVTLPTAYSVQAFAGRTLKAAATWYLALKLMNGGSKEERKADRPG